MAPGSDGDYREEATSYQPLMEETTTTMRQLLTASSIGTLTSSAPSLSSSSSDTPGDSLHSRSPLTLPIDLVVEILCRLPVKLLMQLRCVCKSWNSLIFEPKFAKKHLRWSRTLFSRHHLVGRDCRSRDKRLLWDSTLPSVFNSSGSTSIPETQLSCPINHGRDCYNYNTIVGSCDGILCFTTGKLYSSILVWNPSIRKFKILPPSEINQPGSPTLSYTIYGFGYDHLTDNYKVVAVCNQWNTSNWVSKTMVKVHTLGTNSWRRIRGFPSTLLGFPVVAESGKFVSGTINWLVTTAPRSSWAIVSLDLGNESYQELLQLDYGEGVAVWTLTLGVLRDCLCVLSHIGTFLDVWVMKDYGNKESWTKLFTFPYKELLCCACLYSAKVRYISEDDQVLLNFGDGMDKIVVYNSRNGTVKFPELQYISDWFVTDVYVESLISP